MQYCACLFSNNPINVSINKPLTIHIINISFDSGIVSLFGGKMVSQRKRIIFSKLSDLIQEDLSGISAIKIYAQENAEKKNLTYIMKFIVIQLLSY